MSQIDLKELSIRFGDFTAVDDVTLTVNDGEFVVYLGPSGCGKTTTLRAIAGLDAASSGDILFDGKRVNDLSASERNIAMVFQFVSLYPNLTVAENIAFPLRARGVPATDIHKKLDWAAGLFRLGDDLRRYPGTLPPGTTQKVALARAVVRDPAVLLLDEPLSAIDEQFREEMRWELGHLQRELGVTTIYVTHDQREAMSLADRIVLMDEGRIVQVDEPHALFFRPVSVFAGQFIGSPSMNLIDLTPAPGGLRLADSDVVLPPTALPAGLPGAERPIVMGIRPRDLRLQDSVGDTSFVVPVEDVFSVGRERYFTCRLGNDLLQGVDARTSGGRGAAPVTIAAESVVYFDRETGRRIETAGLAA